MKSTILVLLISILSLTFSSSPNKSQSESDFSIILLSDTQYYSLKDKWKDRPRTYNKQAEWIAKNTKKENVVFTIHLGDMTHRNTKPEWEVASEAHAILDKFNLAYSVVPGNHDYKIEGNHVRKNDNKLYNKYFGPDRFANKSFYGGCFENDNDNNYCYFEHDEHKFLVISLEFAPRKDVLCWANDLITQHKKHNIIVVSHCYQKVGGDHAECGLAYDVIGSDGKDVWNELISRHSNVVLALSGHIGDSEFRTRIGQNGNKVYEILTDYQFEEWHDNEYYGNGWMRKLKFRPSQNRIEVESFTVLNEITTFGRSTYNSDPNHKDHKYPINDVVLNRNYQFKNDKILFNDRTINQSSTLNQKKPKVSSSNANNSFVSVWQDNRNSPINYGIFARSFNQDGCALSNDFKVSVGNKGNKINPDVAVFDDGSFIVVWQDDKDGNGYYQIACRKFNSLGQPLSKEIIVNSNYNGQQLNPKVVASKNGSFVITWDDDKDKNNYFQIHAAVFNKNCKKVVGDFAVNSVSDGNQRKPNIAMDSNNNYFVVWEDDSDNNKYYQIYCAGFQSLSKSKLFKDMVINQDYQGQQLNPVIDADASGSFTVSWEDDKDKNGVFQIYAASFDINGKRIHKDIVVNQFPNGQQLKPNISKDKANGNYYIVWQDDKDGNDVYQIKFASFTKDGKRISKDKTINKDESGQQLKPSITTINSHNIILWQDDTDGNGYYEIVGKNKKI